MGDWLRDPRLYGWTQRMLTSRRCWNSFVDKDLRPLPGERLLDLGCGTGLLLGFLPEVEYHGLDANPSYVRFAQKKWAGRGDFIRADLSVFPWPVHGPFDLMAATGLLHHLPDGEVLKVLRSARGLLKPHGRLVTFDGCFEKGQKPLARLLLSMDRGRFVRDREGYLALARSVFPRVVSRVERRFLRVPYTHLVMEMTAE